MHSYSALSSCYKKIYHNYLVSLVNKKSTAKFCCRKFNFTLSSLYNNPIAPLRGVKQKEKQDNRNKKIMQCHKHMHTHLPKKNNTSNSECASAYHPLERTHCCIFVCALFIEISCRVYGKSSRASRQLHPLFRAGCREHKEDK